MDYLKHYQETAAVAMARLLAEKLNARLVVRDHSADHHINPNSFKYVVAFERFDYPHGWLSVANCRDYTETTCFAANSIDSACTRICRAWRENQGMDEDAFKRMLGPEFELKCAVAYGK